MADEVDDPVLVLEDLRHLAVRPLVDEADLEALVEEGHHLEPLHHRLGPELDLLEDGGVRPERHGRPGPAPGRLAGDLELADRLAPVLELEDVVVAVAVDLQDQTGGQGVDHRDAHAVQAAGDLVPAPSPNLPPAWSTVSTTSAADLPPCSFMGRWGFPGRCRRPGRPPSASSVTSIWVQYPAMASSTALSTTSQTR